MYKLLAYAALALATLAAGADAAIEHKVRRGETLAEIAKAYKVTVQAIKDANGIRNENRIVIGQKLTIPGVTPVSGATHVVRQGETLAEIASDYGVSLKELKDANHLTDANRITIGQKLVVPGASQSRSPAPASPAARDRTHTVKASETLTEIAAAYQVTVAAIMAANGLSDANLIAVGQEIKIPAAVPQYIEYTIRNGDNLSDIAKRHGTTVAELSRLNAISNASRIRVGQAIRIPAGSSPAATYAQSRYPQLPSYLQSSLARIKVQPNQWRHIVIHHSATRSGSARGMDRYHRNERHMENGLAYHFVIGNGRGMKDGEIAIGGRWEKQIQGGHLSSYLLNQVSIGICLVGDFSKSKPTEKQLEALESLVRYLIASTSVPVERVTTHTLIHPKHTLCPGEYFPTASFKARLRR